MYADLNMEDETRHSRHKGGQRKFPGFMETATAYQLSVQYFKSGLIVMIGQIDITVCKSISVRRFSELRSQHSDGPPALIFP